MDFDSGERGRRPSEQVIFVLFSFSMGSSFCLFLLFLSLCCFLVFLFNVDLIRCDLIGFELILI